MARVARAVVDSRDLVLRVLAIIMMTKAMISLSIFRSRTDLSVISQLERKRDLGLL